MIFCLIVAVLQVGAAISFWVQGSGMKGWLMLIYAISNVLLAFMPSVPAPAQGTK